MVLNLINSRPGRAIMATRDNRIAAESVGINVTKYKLMAFVLSAFLAGMAGVLYGLNFCHGQARQFNFDTSILVLVFVVLGGMGNIRGSIIAATVLTILPEVLRDFSDYRMLVYAIVLILVMLLTNSPVICGPGWAGSLNARLQPCRIPDGENEKGGEACMSRKCRIGCRTRRWCPYPSHSMVPERDVATPPCWKPATWASSLAA